MTSAVPATVLFVLTARPARLYAESAQPPIACSDPNIQACTGKNAGDPCTFTNAVDAATTFDTFCRTSACEPDAGVPITALACEFVVPCITPAQVDNCTGKSPGDVCGDGGHCTIEHCPIFDAGAWDGSTELACITLPQPVPTPDAGPNGNDASADAGTTDRGCTCDAAGTSSGPAAGSFAALLIALTAFARSRARSKP